MIELSKESKEYIEQFNLFALGLQLSDDDVGFLNLRELRNSGNSLTSTRMYMCGIEYHSGGFRLYIHEQGGRFLKARLQVNRRSNRVLNELIDGVRKLMAYGDIRFDSGTVVTRGGIELFNNRLNLTFADPYVIVDSMVMMNEKFLTKELVDVEK